MIALGESIVITGATASGENLTSDRWLAIALGFLLSAAMWWLYFDEVARRAAEDFKAAADERGRLGRDAYTYLHIPIVAGIIVIAVGLELVVGHPDVALEVSLAVVVAVLVLLSAAETAGRLRGGLPSTQTLETARSGQAVPSSSSAMEAAAARLYNPAYRLIGGS